MRVGPDRESEDDGLYLPEVGAWAEEKYELVFNYSNLFATSMKARWERRAYVDLFAGAGLAQVRNSQRILVGTPLLALQVDDAFDRYVFCDSDPDCLNALKRRVSQLCPDRDVRYVAGDVNESTQEIHDALPSYGPEKRVLGFCLADPFRLRDLHLETLRALAHRFMDFLVLVPAMDAIRNVAVYTGSSGAVVDDFLGGPGWRREWQEADARVPFDRFVAEALSARMKEMGYAHGGLEDAVMVRSSEKNLPLYRLAFFSRHELGGRFWKEARKYSTAQQSLFD